MNSGQKTFQLMKENRDKNLELEHSGECGYLRWIGEKTSQLEKGIRGKTLKD